MKALRLKETRHYEMVNIPEPVQDGKHVLVDIEMVGLCGSDITIWKGSKVFPSGVVIGHEFCGIVTDPGPRTDLKAGDRVVGIPLNYCRHCFFCDRGEENLCNETVVKGGPGVSIDGACSPKFAIEADKAMKISRDIDSRAAAMVEPLAATHHAAITIGDIQPGEKVLVIGAGIMGILIAWWAKQAGAWVVVSEMNPERIKMLRKCDIADEIVNPSEEGALDELLKKAGLGFDKVFEASVPNDKLYNETLIKMTRKGGIIIEMACLEGLVALNFFAMQYKELTLKFSWSETDNDFVQAVKAAENSPEDFLPLVTDVISMDKVQAKVQQITEKKSNSLKVMIDPNI